MNLKEGWQAYKDFSIRASDVARQLAFAGIALIWAFKSQNLYGAYVLEWDLLVAGALIVVALTLDLLHYAVGALIWGWYARRKEKRGATALTSIKAPNRLTWPMKFFFWLKIVFVVAAYVVLLGHVWNRLAGMTSVVT